MLFARSFVGLAVLAAIALGLTTGAWGPAVAGSSTAFEAPGTRIDEHVGPYGLCGTRHIYPVAAFYGQYVDQIGNHYHLWRPPAGPPFAELCLPGSDLTWKAPAP